MPNNFGMRELSEERDASKFSAHTIGFNWLAIEKCVIRRVDLLLRYTDICGDI